MHKCYHQLAYDERCQIRVLLSKGFSMRSIAGDLNRSPATISREIARNRGERGYRHDQAQAMSSARRSEASGVPRKLTEALWSRIGRLIRQGWSPEQVEGRLKHLGEETVGREWIYRQVRADREEGGDLYLHLRRRGRKPNWKGGRHAGRGHIPGRVDIAERPAVVEEKSRIGDWELDTIIGARHRGALLSSVDRASWYTILELLGGKAAAPVTEALLRRLGPHRDRVHTLTADNGKEFAGHREVAEGLDAGFYFATPYHSWERGLNEHVNGLVREYFPKGVDFRQVTTEQVREVEDRLNHRPRKALGYRTPYEVFHGGLSPS